MTPEEHYEQAETLADASREQVNMIAAEGNTFTPEEMNSFVFNLTAMSARGTLHAKLAEVGLLLRQAGSAAEQFADEIDARNEVWAKLHDFPADVGKFGTGRNCRKCGRCEKHRGAECGGRQENSTAKTCMVCIAGRGA